MPRHHATDLPGPLWDGQGDDATDATPAGTDGLAFPGDERAGDAAGQGRRVVLGLPGGATDEVFLLSQVGLEVLAVESSGPTLLAAVEHYRPDLVLLHTFLRGANNRLPATFAALCGAPTILLVPPELRAPDHEENLLLPGFSRVYPPALLAEAERLGCPFLAVWPPDLAELRMVVTQALALFRAAPAGRPPGPGPGTRGRVLVVRADKGGVGKSSFSVNLACALGIRGGRRVLLMDLDSAGASLHTHLGLPALPQRGIEALHAALRGQPEDEPIDLAPYVLEYPPPSATRSVRQDAVAAPEGAPGLPADGGRLHLLPGFQDPGAAKLLADDEPAILTLLRAAREQYEDVVIDVGTDKTSHHHLLLCARADRVLIVAEPTEDAFTRTADGQKQVMNTTGLPAARCLLVVNRVADARREVVLEDIRKRFGDIGVLGLLPEETSRVRGSLSAHLPWILSAERADRASSLVGAMEEIVNTLTPGLLPTSRVGPLARLLGRGPRSDHDGALPRPGLP